MDSANGDCEWCLYIYLLTPWCRVLLEKLTSLQLVKKFPAFHGIRRFITTLTSFRQLSLSWASPIQSIYPHPTSWRSTLILSTHLRLVSPVVSFPPVSSPTPHTPPSPQPYAPHAQPISFIYVCIYICVCVCVCDFLNPHLFSPTQHMLYFNSFTYPYMHVTCFGLYLGRYYNFGTSNF